MPDNEHYDELLYQYEILLAKQAVREHFLKTVVREVYENIGQVLSLIRVQLSTLQAGFTNGEKESVNSSGELVGQTIRELRTMCRLFYPKENILVNEGLAETFRAEINIQYPTAVCAFTNDAAFFSQKNTDQSMLLYSILLELLELIKEEGKGSLLHVAAEQKKTSTVLLLDYTGRPIRAKNSPGNRGWPHLSVYQRVKLLGGKLEIKKTGTDNIRIKLALPTHQTT